MGAYSTAVIVTDVLLRRLCLPLVLVASAVLRYNVLSLVNLLLFLVSLLLPGPHLKAQKASSLVYLSVVVVWSFLATLGQSLFQIVLATGYSDRLQPCNQQESSWRQFGLILFHGTGVDAADIVRHILPDFVVFLAALANLVTSGYIVARIRKMDRISGVVLQEECPSVQDIESEGATRPLPTPGYPLHIQSYWQLPKIVVLLFEVSTFITLCLSGVAVPSLTSFTYYAMFLLILAAWSCHQAVKWRGCIRVLRCCMTFYTMLHLISLYLYQFQAAQQNIPIKPDDTSKSLLARLFGLTPIILTDCEYPTRLQLHHGLESTVFVNAALLVLLCLLLATDMRLWINTPEILWKRCETYHLPVRDSLPSPTLHLVSSGRSSSPVQWSQYGTYKIRGSHRQEPAVEGVSEEDAAEYVGFKEEEKREGDTYGSSAASEHARRQCTWKDIRRRSLQFVKSSWHVLLQISYVPAIVCMMFWSVLYPSWPALLLLYWACTIWLIPKFTPKNSLFYTSPALVVYAVCLLVLQYVFSLNLTSSELSPVDGVGKECHENNTPGCKSFVPLIKTAFTIVFFCALHEFVRIKFNKHTHIQDDTADGEMPLIPLHAKEDTGRTAPATAVQQMGSKLITEGFYLLSTYWILVVVAAFLLVFLSGEPSVLKTVYLIFFFLFLVMYQVFERCWYYVCIPVWWGLVLYAALELTLIYTYQFDSISDAWEKAYNNTPLTVNSEDLFRSIGLRKYGINSLRSLCVSLIPPAVFIAVMAIQLRYFNPLRQEVSSQRTAIETEGGTAGPDSVSRTSSVASAVAREKSVSYFYQLPPYLWKKSKQIMCQIVQISWRFLELHLHKFSMVVLFWVVLSEVSAGYWVLLGVSLMVIPLPYFNKIMYPLLTLYIGLLLVIKTTYQYPIVAQYMFNLTTLNGTDDGGQCSGILNTTLYVGNYSGLVYNYQYSSRINDGGWLGLHKVANYALYIMGPLCLALLLSLNFSVKRHQVKIYRSENIEIGSWEKGSLFLNISRSKAETSVLMAGKYIINHVFEMYGIEITLVAMAISVAVRIDVYGVFYCIVVGVLLVFPRRLMAPLWLFYVVVHGLLLLLQYSMLLGVPPGACFYPGGRRGYPWDVLVDQTTTNFCLKKWLFLTDYPQMLEKVVLYGNFCAVCYG
ncbi:Piezo-type mechanosensitive ion channel component 1 [Geodia barretti]|uniref:Piezo-type mechanosensitive ion channel component 1 n=1 Tax=Geodia barretti TaxID=519541 RepID=A0AA35RM69_GEOBA|nr:Piezo-type mechanosensitive ion channel component 1 [Geodia barretti]